LELSVGGPVSERGANVPHGIERGAGAGGVAAPRAFARVAETESDLYVVEVGLDLARGARERLVPVARELRPELDGRELERAPRARVVRLERHRDEVGGRVGL